MKLLLLLLTGIWIGLIIGISFIETPLKFRAPGITLELGLGIGKMLFGVLSKIEMAFSVVIAASLLFCHEELGFDFAVIMCFVVLLVLIDTIWLLPVLNARVDLVFNGNPKPPSFHHFLYVILECTKVLLLVVGFIKNYNHG